MSAELLPYLVVAAMAVCDIAIGYSIGESYTEAKKRDKDLTFGKYFSNHLR
jgi:hypothetical protein